MNKNIISIAAAALISIAQPSSAQMVNGNILLDFMEESNAFDVGYVIGVYDAHQNIDFCVPRGVSSGQLNDVTKIYIMSRSQAVRLEPAQKLVRAALAQSWPCGEKIPQSKPRAF